jgi:hypothetical protein
VTPYTKVPVGNKLFVVEWFLEADESEEVGTPFEAVNCELVSVSAETVVASGSGIASLGCTNQPSPAPAVVSGYAISLQPLGNNCLLPWPNAADNVFITLPKTRYVFPRLDASDTGAAATSRVCCLFKEL